MPLKATVHSTKAMNQHSTHAMLKARSWRGREGERGQEGKEGGSVREGRWVGGRGTGREGVCRKEGRGGEQGENREGGRECEGGNVREGRK